MIISCRFGMHDYVLCALINLSCSLFVSDSSFESSCKPKYLQKAWSKRQVNIKTKQVVILVTPQLEQCLKQALVVGSPSERERNVSWGSILSEALPIQQHPVI